MNLRRVSWGLAALVLLAAGALVWQIGPRNIVGMLLYDQRREGSLKVGDLAPDVELSDLAGTTRRLHEFVGEKPLVLIFGSFT